jgi:hypothetical protein
LRQLPDPVDEIMAVVVFEENVALFDAASDDVVQHTGRIDSRNSGHVLMIPNSGPEIKQFLHERP